MSPSYPKLGVVTQDANGLLHDRSGLHLLHLAGDAEPVGQRILPAGVTGPGSLVGPFLTRQLGQHTI